MGGCQRTLKPGSKEGAPTRYKISVKTGDARGAGTSADVSITVFGSLGDSGERLLDTSANDFERGAKDHFFFECTTLGRSNALRSATTDAACSQPGSWTRSKSRTWGLA